MKSLNGLVTLVTGGGQGLGKAIAQTLAKAGASVIVTGHNSANIQAVTDKINRSGGKAKSIVMDVSDKESISKTIRAILKTDKKLDVVINNAATDVTKPIEQLTVEQIDRIVRVNLLGPFLITKYALEAMYRQKSGHVINIASTGGKRAWPNASAYNTTKWGLLGLSRALYTEARQYNVRISVIVPGGMRTPFILERFPDTPLDKLQDPQVVAETVKFVLQVPKESIIPEIMILPLQETSWP